MPQELVAACLDYLNGKIDRRPQRAEDGNQYFIMHPRLINLAGMKLGMMQE
jgi:hypothetical protein